MKLMEMNQPEQVPQPYKKKRGRHTTKEAKNLQVVKALMDSRSPIDAYMKLHPKSSRASAMDNAKRMLTPEVMAEFRSLLAIDKLTVVNRDNLEKFLLMVLVGWTQGKESTQNYLKAVDILTRLSGDLVHKVEYKDEVAINKRLEELGYKPEG